MISMKGLLWRGEILVDSYVTSKSLVFYDRVQDYKPPGLRGVWYRVQGILAHQQRQSGGGRQDSQQSGNTLHHTTTPAV